MIARLGNAVLGEKDGRLRDRGLDRPHLMELRFRQVPHHDLANHGPERLVRPAYAI